MKLDEIKSFIRRLLRKTERFTGTDNLYLAKNGGYLFLNQAANVLNGFVLYILIAHFLPKEVYGQYKYLIALYGIFSSSALTGIDNALTRSIAKGKEGSLHLAFRLKLKGGFIGAIFVIILGIYYLLSQNPNLAVPLFMMAIIAPVIFASNVGYSYFIGIKRFDLYLKTSVATTCLYFIGMSMAFVFLKNPILIFFVYLLSTLPVFLVYLYARRKTTANESDPDLKSYGLHLSYLDIFSAVANQIDGILIFHFLGPTSLAAYSLATVPVEQLKGFLKTVQSVALPKFTNSNLSILKNTFYRKMLIFMAAIAGLIGIYIILARPFYQVFFPRYLDSVIYSQVYSLSLIFATPASLIFILFLAKGMRKETAQWNIMNYSVQIILLILGAWLYGIWGAIAARLVSRIFMFADSLYIMNKTKDHDAEGEPITA